MERQKGKYLTFVLFFIITMVLYFEFNITEKLSIPLIVKELYESQTYRTEYKTESPIGNSMAQGTIAPERFGSDINLSRLNIKTNSKKHTSNTKLFKLKHGTENCEPLLNGNEFKIQRVLKKMENLKPTDVFEDFEINKTKNCQEYIQHMGYIMQPISKKETEFPIAYTILMYRDVLQAEILLRAIYRPQNAYCIHVDKTSKNDVKEAMISICRCFDNVFISSHNVDVEWGQFSLLEPELICMEDLWHHKIKWKYLINLTGHEFPLRTNLELVHILDLLNGTNVLEKSPTRRFEKRWKDFLPAPHGIQPTKGNVHIAVNRDYVDYVLHNKTALDFLEWVKQTQLPDETFFSSLNHNPHLGIRKHKTDNSVYPYLARFINWSTHEYHNETCRGKWRRDVCLFGVGDLQLLIKRKEFFINKLFWNYQPFTLFCLEQWHRNKTINDYMGVSKVNLTYYQNLDFLKHRVD